MNRVQIISALLLGDGCIEKSPRKGYSSGYPYRLAVSCSDLYSEYYFWKKKLMMSQYNNAEFVEYYSIGSSSSKPSWKLTTKAEVERFYEFLYSNGKKDLRKYLLRINMEPLCMAIWFMDDGGVYNCKNKNRDGRHYWSTPLFSLATNNHSISEVEYAVSYFKNHGWDCRYTACDKKDNGECNYRIDFRGSASADIWHTIEPFVKEVGIQMLWKFRVPYHLYSLGGSRDDIELSTLDSIKTKLKREAMPRSHKCERQLISSRGDIYESTWSMRYSE